jgi:hypothetical protein
MANEKVLDTAFLFATLPEIKIEKKRKEKFIKRLH